MSDEPARPEPVRVVLADDASEMRALLRWALLRDEGVVVVAEASDGREALALVQEHRPDVVVLDLQMPGPPPDELLTAMAQTSPGTPIVTFSGFDPELVAPRDAAHPQDDGPRARARVDRRRRPRRRRHVTVPFRPGILRPWLPRVRTDLGPRRPRAWSWSTTTWTSAAGCAPRSRRPAWSSSPRPRTVATRSTWPRTSGPT
jgi:CheY-like chemotaxis protein